MIATENELKTKRGIVYLIKNKINQKYYIGKAEGTFNQRYGSKWWTSKNLKFLKISFDKDVGLV